MAAFPKHDIRTLLAATQPVFNAWLQLGLPLAAEIIADAGWQVLTIDQQHGLGDNIELTGNLLAAKAAGVPALVRVSANDFGLIGRALDAGAHGVIVPMVETGEDAARVAEAVKYPPLGGRSYGPYRGRLMLEGDYFEHANGWTIACGQIETKLAVDNIDEILATPGLDMILVGPNDLAISISGGDRDIRLPAVIEAIEYVRRKAAERGVIGAIFANDTDYAKQMIGKGWQIITVGTDANWLAAAAQRQLEALR